MLLCCDEVRSRMLLNIGGFEVDVGHKLTLEN